MTTTHPPVVHSVDADVTGVFPSRPRPGIVMGLRLGQVGLYACSGGLLVAAVFTGVFRGPSRGLVFGVAAVLAVLAASTVEGRTGYGYLTARAMHAWRTWRGDTAMGRPVYAGAVGAFPQVQHAIGLLPGRAASIAVHEHDGVAFLVHPGQGTITAVVEVASPEFLLRDAADRSARVAAWERALAATTRGGAVRQLQVLERSIPDDGSELTAYTGANLSTDPRLEAAADTYRGLVGGLRGGTDRHHTYLALTVDSTVFRNRREIRETGGRVAAATRRWWQEYALLARLLPTAGVDIVCLLDASALARVIRTGFDPATVLHLPPEGTNLSAAGPVAGREEWDHLRTDGAFHAVLWVAEWPRAHVAADVLWPVVFPPGVHRSLSLCYRPFTRVESEAAIRAKHSEILQSSWLKGKLGRVETLADSKELGDVLNRETELLAGHGEVGLTGLITITAPTVDQLESDVITVHAAGTQASLDVRRIYGQQLQAFTAAALPLGIQVTP